MKRPGHKKAKAAKPSAEELIPLTVTKVRRLLWWLVWRKMPGEQQVIEWSEWRRKHQAKARRSHYKRRLAKYKHLQL